MITTTPANFHAVESQITGLNSDQTQLVALATQLEAGFAAAGIADAQVSLQAFVAAPTPTALVGVHAGRTQRCGLRCQTLRRVRVPRWRWRLQPLRLRFVGGR